MAECDKAFKKSIIGRENFSELFDKINANGMFITAYHTYVMGYAVIYANDFANHEGFITLIAVCPEYQGMHIGRKILSACCEAASGRKMRRLRLEVRNDNEKAIRFYEKNGFAIEKPCSHDSSFMVRSL